MPGAEPTRPRRQAALALGLGAAAVAALAAFLAWGPGDDRTRLLVADGSVLAAAGLAAAVAVHAALAAPRLRPPWFLAAGLALFALGEAYWFQAEVLRGAEVPVLSPADPFYLAGYVGVTVALASWLPALGRRFDRTQRYLDALTLTSSTFAIAWIAYLRPVAAAGAAETGGAVVATLYPALDVVLALLFVFLALEVPRGARRRFWCLAGAFTAWVVADVVYALEAAGATYASGLPTDALWVAGYLLAAAGAATAAREAQFERTPAIRTLRSSTFLVHAPLLVVIPAAIADYAVRRSMDAVLFSTGIVLVIALGARQLTFSLALLDAAGKLNDANRQLNEAQRLARIGSWELDIATDRLTWSAETYRIFGLPQETFGASYEAFLRLVHPDDRAWVDHAYKESLAHHQPYSVEHRLLPADGGAERIVLEQGATTYEGGRPIRSVGTVQDVTEQRHAERAQREIEERQREIERLREVARLKTQFLNTAAHELGTPLTPLRIQVAVLRRHPEIPDSAQKALDVLDRNLERLGVLVQDLLDAARLQSGTLRLVPADIDVDATVADVVHLFADKAQAEEVRLSADVPAGLALAADPARLQQILVNLVHNALKFTPQGGRVDVRARTSAGGVEFRVSDTGVGLDAAQIDRLFKPFAQVHDPQKWTKAKGGSGLGLFVCKGIVEQHGGRIGVTSDGPGKGSTFWFWLPSVATPPPGASEAQSVSTPPLPEPAASPSYT